VPIEIRHPTEAELPAYLESLSTAFLQRPDVAMVAVDLKPFWDLNRLWAAFEGDRIAGTFRSWPTELTVPGGQCLPASAISAVTVLPTHRRRGILRSMIATEHAAMRDRGEVLGLLHSAEYPIYGRFGYGPGCPIVTWTLNARTTAFHDNPPGTIEFVLPSDSTREMMKRVFDAWRVGQPGEIRRRDYGWDFDLGLRETGWQPRWKGFVVLRGDAAGNVDGYVRYRAEEKWDQGQNRGIITVDDFQASSDDAYTALWRFLGNVDLVATVKAENRNPRERLPWLLTNARAAVASDLFDGLWVRVLDVPRALEARTYEREASLVLELIDTEAPGGRLRLHLDAGPEGATCRPTDRSPDLTFDVAALGASYLGGPRLRDAVLAKGVDEHRPGALLSLDRLLKTLDEPWCSTFF
jgi:predicted acetyltransferase